MKKNRWICLILSFVLVVTVLSGCTKAKDDDGLNATFSNIIKEDETKELSGVLSKVIPNKKSINKLIDSIENYNETIGKDLLYSEGIIDYSNPIPKYNEEKIEKRWSEKNELFIGYNCRLTAFLLMKDFITIDDVGKGRNTALFLDEDAIINSRDDYFTEDEMEKFLAFYGAIDTTSSTDEKNQYEIQQKYWDDIGVKFDNNKGISLISVYIHNHYSDEENELIIGHTGVLIENADGYIFIEKLSFQNPYQMVRFQSKKDLERYLMAAYDTDTTGECAKPFILENDLLLM